jgi:hypothetical protein
MNPGNTRNRPKVIKSEFNPQLNRDTTNPEGLAGQHRDSLIVYAVIKIP